MIGHLTCVAVPAVGGGGAALVCQLPGSHLCYPLCGPDAGVSKVSTSHSPVSHVQHWQDGRGNGCDVCLL